MKSKSVLLHSFALAWLFLAGCGDANHLDKTVRNSSILRGEKVSETSPAFHRTVLLVQHFEMNGENPTLFGICSGLVLNSRTVLTAAHCLENGTADLKVILKTDPRAGLDPINDVYSVIDWRLNPKYVSQIANPKQSLEQLKNNVDLALIYLDRSLPGTTEIIPTVQKDLLDSNESSMSDLLITGFGRTTALKDTTGMNFWQINGISNAAWIKVDSQVFEKDHFLLNQKETAGVCFGDSGGPVYIKKNKSYQPIAIAIGVYHEAKTQSATENACSGLGLYINIEFYQSWILQAQSELEKSNI